MDTLNAQHDSGERNCYTMNLSVVLFRRTLPLGLLSLIFLVTGLVSCSDSGSETSPPPIADTGTAGAEEAVGERLFLETRFAQAFKASLDNGGDINDPNIGDSVVDTVETLGTPIAPGPFKGLSINCRACHLVDDVLEAPGGGMRTYTDFARRSPVQARADGKTVTVRNSPPLINSALDRTDGLLFHFDAEFNSMEELVAATFTGRNFGWLPGERALAIAHIARVVRSDDGTGDLAKEFDGTPFRVLFGGTDASIPEEFKLTTKFRVAAGSASDQEVFDAIVKVVAAYVNGLLFSQTEDSGAPIRSPFDVFLETNGLPQAPDSNESPLGYSRRLLQLVQARETAGTLQFVTSNPNRADGQFQFHTQSFSFGAQELAGLKMFLAEPASLPASQTELTTGRIGNCIVCHAAPNFTDFKAHNTGTTQKEYDELSGHDAFMNLVIPALNMRTPDDLPATEQHPTASERFRAVPVAGTTFTDLGLWNVFANPDVPTPQSKIRTILCDQDQPCTASQSDLLDRAIARFKTPGLRDLGHSAPFMHNGQFNRVDDVLAFYREVSDLARAGQLRNGASQLQGIALKPTDLVALVAFLNSLNEDYQ